MKFPDLVFTNYAARVQKLYNEFTSRFPELRLDKINNKTRVK